MEISTLENLVELVRCQMELHVLNLTILSLPYPRVSPCRPHFPPGPSQCSQISLGDVGRARNRAEQSLTAAENLCQR